MEMLTVRNAFLLAGGLGLLAVGAYAAFLIYGRMVETWPYEIAERDGAFELRIYPALRVAEVTTEGSRRDAVRAGFGPLARYIFARERDGRKISMTAPVTQEPVGDASWRVRFIMPSGYNLDDLPAPAAADVRLLETAPTRMAAVRFDGGWDDARFTEQEQRLRTWLAARDLAAHAPATYAYYNDPFTPGFLRRNEVLIDIGAG